MHVIVQFFQGILLIILTVAIHATVFGWCISRLRIDQPLPRRSFASDTLFLSRLAIWVILAHLLSIVLWGLFFYWRQVMPDAEIGFYFSAVTYATIGYGDIVPPTEWRLLAAMEGLTGLLMCAWSGGFFFAVIARMYFSATTDGEAR